jgi:hypothetical protein
MRKRRGILVCGGFFDATATEIPLEPFRRQSRRLLQGSRCNRIETSRSKNLLATM